MPIYVHRYISAGQYAYISYLGREKGGSKSNFIIFPSSSICPVIVSGRCTRNTSASFKNIAEGRHKVEGFRAYESIG